MSGETLPLLIAFAAVFGGVVGMIRGHNVAVAIIVSALLFPIGPFLVLLIPGGKKCPQCRSRIDRRALVCRHCGYRYSGAPVR